MAELGRFLICNIGRHNYYYVMPSIGAAPNESNLHLYAEMGGIPTLHYGPSEVRLAHGPREQVDIAELISTTRSLALLAARRCGAYL